MRFKDFLTEATEEDKLKHLEHVEDHVLHAGKEGFGHAFHTVRDVHHKLQGIKSDTQTTIKYDGSPAVVFGEHPENKKFFVASKSAFNKNPKINHTHEDIEKNHGHAPGLVEKLKAALDHAHKIKPQGVYQADIMHAGDVKKNGNSVEFTPNTITYIFDEIVSQDIIVAPHTQYHVADGSSLRDAVATPFLGHLDDTDTCKFVQPKAWQIDEDFDDVIGFARQMSQLVDFVDQKDAAKLKIELNKCVREGREVAPETFYNSRLISFWLLIKSIKDDMLFLCRNNGPKSYIGNRQCGGEGYVRTNEFGMFKLVNREKFSHANFNLAKSWS